MPCTGLSLTCMKRVMADIGKITSLRDEAGISRPCLAACQDQVNRVHVTNSDFPNRNTFEKREELCLVLLSLDHICESEKKYFLEESLPGVCRNIAKFKGRIGGQRGHDDLCVNGEWVDPRLKWGIWPNDSDWKNLVRDLFRYSKENLAILNVYISEPAVQRIVRDEKISTISFIANVGGLLGLCMGYSLVSSWEIVYYIGIAVQKAFKSKN